MLQKDSLQVMVKYVASFFQGAMYISCYDMCSDSHKSFPTTLFSLETDSGWFSFSNTYTPTHTHTAESWIESWLRTALKFVRCGDGQISSGLVGFQTKTQHLYSTHSWKTALSTNQWCFLLFVCFFNTDMDLCVWNKVKLNGLNNVLLPTFTLYSVDFLSFFFIFEKNCRSWKKTVGLMESPVCAPQAVV